MTHDAARRLRQAKTAAQSCLAAGESVATAAAAAQVFGSACADNSDVSDSGDEDACVPGAQLSEAVSILTPENDGKVSSASAAGICTPDPVVAGIQALQLESTLESIRIIRPGTLLNTQ